MSESLNKLIKRYINKDNLDLDQKVQLLDELYWADWESINNDPNIDINKLFNHLQSENLDIEEIGKIMSLYNNLDGAYTQEFAKVIANLYTNDRIKFFQGLNLNQEETINIVYVFRMIKMFEDSDIEFKEVKDMNKLRDEEIDTTNTFYNMYETICNT